MFGKHARHARHHPCLGVADVNAVFGILEIINIRGMALRAACLTCQELGELASKREL